uniref:VapC9 PIN-like domain-containing protein n=3 Tax=environmental samples TaxID=68359 RepID=A0A075FVA0_9EURY|nr:hypothetical protein [uncultured marine group II/III euryarchaeote AD1000_34_D01]AIE98317.1 hypothetical protein [uncultured marine group II/III euryarchaeote KM3_05_F04]AIF20132.1 hypothetical protein [uncultured marine group II/III euryarchaeote KM3_88_E02]
MTKLLIDACGWVAAIDGGINFDHAISPLIGKFEPVILPRVRKELQSVQEGRAKTLLLDLLDGRAEVVEPPEGMDHTDDQLVALAMENSWPVLTIDRDLKQRLADAGCPFIEVISGHSVRLIEF